MDVLDFSSPSNVARVHLEADDHVVFVDASLHRG